MTTTIKTTKDKYGKVRKRVSIEFPEKTKTEQSHVGATNINSIMKRYHRSGLLPRVQGSPMFGDFTRVEDYHAAQGKLIAAQEEFLALPAEIRQRFDNNAGNLVGFLLDPGNEEEAIALGLIVKPAGSSSVPAKAPEVAEVAPNLEVESKAKDLF